MCFARDCVGMGYRRKKKIASSAPCACGGVATGWKVQLEKQMNWKFLHYF